MRVGCPGVWESALLLSFASVTSVLKWRKARRCWGAECHCRKWTGACGYSKDALRSVKRESVAMVPEARSNEAVVKTTWVSDDLR